MFTDFAACSAASPMVRVRLGPTGRDWRATGDLGGSTPSPPCAEVRYPMRVLIAVDGSAGAADAVALAQTIAWPAQIQRCELSAS